MKKFCDRVNCMYNFYVKVVYKDWFGDVPWKTPLAYDLHLLRIIFISLVFLASRTLPSLSICSPFLFLQLSPLSSITYGLASFLHLMIMIPIHVLFISSVRVANVLLLCHCTPNLLFIHLTLNCLIYLNSSYIIYSLLIT